MVEDDEAVGRGRGDAGDGQARGEEAGVAVEDVRGATAPGPRAQHLDPARPSVALGAHHGSAQGPVADELECGDRAGAGEDLLEEDGVAPLAQRRERRVVGVPPREQAPVGALQPDEVARVVEDVATAARADEEVLLGHLAVGSVGGTDPGAVADRDAVARAVLDPVDLVVDERGARPSRGRRRGRRPPRVR